MIVHENVEQGSAQWLALRIGKPTSSDFHRIITPTGKLSTQSKDYAHRLVAERLLNRTLDSIDGLKWVEHGRESEEAAAKQFGFEEEVKLRRVGFITTDNGKIGASPDRLVDERNEAVEIKCCSPQVHIGLLLEGFDRKHYPQVQGQLLVGEFDCVTRYAWHAELPSVLDRTYRDEPFISKLRTALDQFTDELEEMYQRALASGAFQVAPQVQTAHEQAYAGDPGATPFEMGDEFGGAFA